MQIKFFLLHLYLYYYDLKYERDVGWTYSYAGKRKKLYGGALLENLVQALARIITMDAGVRVRQHLDEYGIRLALTVHDELVYTVPHEWVNYVRGVLINEMKAPVKWAPGLPLAVEASVGPTYGDAK